MNRHNLVSILRPTVTDISVTDLSNELNRLLGRESKKGIDISKELVRSQRAQIFNDLPSDVDEFGFSPVIRTLSEIALSEATQTPLTVCIDGQWGSGKSSIMQMIEKQARLVGFPCVWLNAWSLEDTDNLVSSLAAEIQRESERWEIERPLTKYWKRFITASGRALLKMSGPANTFLSELEHSGRSVSDEARSVASIVTARRSFEELVKVLLEAIKDSPTKSDFREESSAVESRLIVFVDDIDRALPDQIVTMLKTLRLVLDNKYCVFVLGMDFELVARSIVNFYSGEKSKLIAPEEMITDPYSLSSAGQLSGKIYQDFGTSFLEKLIQLHVRVPGLDRRKVAEYVQSLDLAAEVIEVIRWAPDLEVLNPRRLKRYINWLSITLQLVKDSTLPEGVSNLTALRVLAFRRDFPELYQKIAARDESFYSLTSIDAEWFDLITNKRHISDDQRPSELKDLENYLHTFVECINDFEKSLVANPLLRSTVSELNMTEKMSRTANN